jgi:hypothetical protein
MLFRLPHASRSRRSPAKEQIDVRIYAAIVGHWPLPGRLETPDVDAIADLDADPVPAPPPRSAEVLNPPTVIVSDWVRRVGGLARTRFVEARVRVTGQ